MQIYKCDNCGVVFEEPSSYHKKVQLDGNDYRVSVVVGLIETKDEREERAGRGPGSIIRIGHRQSDLCPKCLSRVLEETGLVAQRVW